MDTGAARVGAVSLAALAKQTKRAIVSGLGKTAIVASKNVSLPAGPAFVIHVAAAKKAGTNVSDEYLFVHDRVDACWFTASPNGELAGAARRFWGRALPCSGIWRARLPVRSSSQATRSTQATRCVAYPNGNSFAIGEATLDLYDGRTTRARTCAPAACRWAPSTPAKTLDVLERGRRLRQGRRQQALPRGREGRPLLREQDGHGEAGGITTTYHTTAMRNSKLPASSVAVKLVIKATDGKKHITQTGIAIYQVKGDTLSGVYTFVAKGTATLR